MYGNQWIFAHFGEASYSSRFAMFLNQFGLSNYCGNTINMYFCNTLVGGLYFCNNTSITRWGAVVSSQVCIRRREDNPRFTTSPNAFDDYLLGGQGLGLGRHGTRLPASSTRSGESEQTESVSGSSTC